MPIGAATIELAFAPDHPFTDPDVTPDEVGEAGKRGELGSALADHKTHGYFDLEQCELVGDSRESRIASHTGYRHVPVGKRHHFTPTGSDFADHDRGPPAIT